MARIVYKYDAGWAAKLAPPEQSATDLMQGVAAELRPNSRLSCQPVVTEALDGLTVEVPDREF